MNCKICKVDKMTHKLQGLPMCDDCDPSIDTRDPLMVFLETGNMV